MEETLNILVNNITELNNNIKSLADTINEPLITLKGSTYENLLNIRKVLTEKVEDEKLEKRLLLNYIDFLSIKGPAAADEFIQKAGYKIKRSSQTDELILEQLNKK